MQTTYTIKGMHCGACEQRIKQALETLPGVHTARVSKPSDSATIETSDDLSQAELATAVASAGDYELGAPIDPPAASPAQSDHELSAHDEPTQRSWLATYHPLLLIVGYCFGGTVLAGVYAGDWSAGYLMSRFMGLFFVAFSFFKLLDLRGFADAYATYDIIARRFYQYGLVYPFIELSLGITYLLGWQPVVTNVVTLVVMAISTIGVVQAVTRKQEIQCACLGTVFDLPMTTVTIVEDVSMALMAAGMLWRLAV